MKISKLLTALAVAAAVAGFASCSNSSDTPAVPNTPATPATPEGPSVRITGSNVIAAYATTSTYVSEPTRTTLYAFPSNFGTDTIKFTWSIVEGSDHATVPADVYADHVQVTAKDGDATVDSANQTFKVKVLVQSATNASKKAEAEYTVTILKKATAAEGKVPLTFIEWMPDFPYVIDNDVATSDRTYKPKTGETAAINPGDTTEFAWPDPIHNGYSANLADSHLYRKGWVYTTSDTTVAAIVANGAAGPMSEATWGDTNGDGARALIVNKTEKESVTLTVAGNYNLSDTVKPAFTKTVTRKVAKGKKITVKLNANGADPFTYKGSAVTSGSIALDDVYAGVDYVTDVIEGTINALPNVKAQGLINNAASALATTAKAVDGKVTFRVKYDAADNSEFAVKWN